MAKVACAKCKQPMYAAAIACPHCGARRADIKAGLADKNISKDEVRALLLVEAPPPAPSQGVFAPLVLPHPQSHGAVRAVEIVLTLAALPLVLTGAIAFLFTGARRRKTLDAITGEWTPALLMALLGGVLLWQVAGTPITLAALGALFVRTGLRARHYTARSDELSRLD